MHARVYKKENTYQVCSRFNKETKWHNFASEKKAKEVCNEINIAYYSNHKKDLPKGITIDLENNRFRFHVRPNNRQVKHIKSSKDLSELVDIRKHIIKSLLELH
jgi:hypothetical protein